MYNANALNTIYNPSNAVLPNTDIQVPKAVIQPSLGLRQIESKCFLQRKTTWFTKIFCVSYIEIIE